MKKWIVGLWLASAVFLFCYAMAGQGVLLKPDGVNSTAATSWTMKCDSTDTAVVDTIFSDTLDLTKPEYSGYNFAIITMVRDTFIKCDSCNDSFYMTNTIWTQDNAGFMKLLASDVQGMGITAPDTVSLRLYINGTGNGVTPNKDSTIFDKMWIRGIMSDSCITNKAVTGSTLKARYFVYLVK